MARALRHGEWHLISEQKFRRRAAVQETTQVFRGTAFLVLSDKITGQHMRLVARAERIWRAMDGRRTVHEIWQDIGTGPTQSEIFEWVMSLVSAGMLLSDHELDPKHLTDRGIRKRNQLLEAKAAGPLAIKVSLFDPSALINFVAPFTRPIFTPIGGIAIAVLILSALITAALNWPSLAGAVDRNFLSQSGLIGLALAYPLLKIVHEFAHGLLVHKFGGEVRDCGVMFLIFFPVPYVDASDSNAFPDKRARMLVAAGGVLAELTVASLSLFLWLNMEQGFERAILFNFMVIGSISTIFFNGNPLLKFDSYFVLADWLEIPNLAQRSSEFVQDRFLARVLGLRREVFPAQGEAPILATYGMASMAYRWVLTVTITLIVSRMFFVLGILLAIWSAIMSFGIPLKKMIKKGYQMSRSQNRIGPAFWRTLTALAVLFILLFVVRFPFSANGEGQVTVTAEAQIYIESSGEIVEVLQQNGAQIAKSDPLLRITNPDQSARRDMLEIAHAELTQRLQAGGLGVVARQAAQRELSLAAADLERLTRLESAAILTAPQAGTLQWRGGRDPMLGGFVFRGDELGVVVAPEHIEIVISFPAAYAGLLSDQPASVLLADGTTLTAPIARTRVIDQGQQAPAPILVSGGGTIPDMPDQRGLALTPSLVVWMRPQADFADKAGMRLQGRITLPSASLASQAMFHLRRLFLRVNRI
jgi:putative peptide zinc metalloprotease protein